jgi:hypothetical protein
VIGKERVVARIAGCPGDDALRERSANLRDSTRHDASRAGIVVPTDHGDVAFDDTGVRGIAKDDGEVAVNDLAGLNDDRSKVGPAVIDGLRIGQRRSAEHQHGGQAESRGRKQPTDHARGPRSR